MDNKIFELISKLNECSERLDATKGMISVYEDQIRMSQESIKWGLEYEQSIEKEIELLSNELHNYINK